MRISIYWALLALLLVAQTGCKNAPTNNSRNRYKGLAQSEIFDKHAATRLKFKVLQLKGKADFTDEAKNQQMSFTYKIAIAKDSMIVANVSKLGIPGAMMKIDRDSIRIRIPLEKRAMVCDFSYISSILGFEADFATLQNLLIGEAHFFDNAELRPKSPTPVEIFGTVSHFGVSWILNGSSFQLEKVRVKDTNLDAESVVSYSDFQNTDGQSVAMQVLLVATQPSVVRIELKHSSVDFDNERTNFSFRIPRSYEVQPCGTK